MPARTIHCDHAGCKSNATLNERDVSDAAVGPLLTERGWQALWAPDDSGLSKCYCPVHHDTSLPNTRPGKTHD